MIIGLELVINENGVKFLNYWDFKHGNDVCCEIINGELFKSEYDDEAEPLPSRKITFEEFIKLVESVN